MFERLNARFKATEPEPAGPPEALRTFGLSESAGAVWLRNPELLRTPLR